MPASPHASNCSVAQVDAVIVSVACPQCERRETQA
jgi:hypothetical protein